MVGKSRHAPLLDDRDVKRWHDNLAASSIITAGVYLRTIVALIVVKYVLRLF